MVSIFPDKISRKAMTTYFIALVSVSVVFISHIMPFYMMLFGIVGVCAFFYFSTNLTKQWVTLHPKVFVKNLFWTALVVRLVYVVFVYFFYDAMTGRPFMFFSADEFVYFNSSKLWAESGFETFMNSLRYFGIDDTGEIFFTGLLCKVFGPYILTARIGHGVMSALTCVMIYRIGKRHFGESTGRMAAIFCMLMPNLIYYCGLHLKEADMVFVTVWFVDSVDMVVSDHKADFKHIFFALFSCFAMFTFRTVLGAVGVVSIGIAVAFHKGKIGSWWKRVLLIVLVATALATTSIGMRIMGEVDTAWSRRESNQEQGMMARAQSIGGNSFAKYATGAVFAPFIFTIPFPTMYNIESQQNQQMIHGGNFVKNVMSGFTIFALVLLLLSGEWRKHTLPIAMMCGYLAVITLSNFAHSERFHQPAIPFELLFAAFGVSQLKQKHLKWVDYWLAIVFMACIAWGWFKLAGRGAI